MPTPDSKKTARLFAPAVAPTKSLQALAAVSIYDSSGLLRCYRIAYGLVAISLLIALSPWLLKQPWWWPLLILLWAGLWVSYYRQQEGMFAGQLWCDQGMWYTQCGSQTCKYSISGEVVCWSFILILPLRNQETNRLRYLIVARDALSPADNARLRTWLRVCLNPKR